MLVPEPISPQIKPPMTRPPNAGVTARERLLRLPEVMRMTGLSRSHTYRLIKTGHFPAPIPLLNSNTRVVVFVESEIDAWIAEQIAPYRKTKPQ